MLFVFYRASAQLAIQSPVLATIGLSICLSITRWHCIKMMQARITNLHRQIAQDSSLGDKKFIQKFESIHLERGHKMRMGQEKFAIFSQQVAVSQKRCKIGRKLLLMTNRKLHMPFRSVPKSTTLDDLKRPIHSLLVILH